MNAIDVEMAMGEQWKEWWGYDGWAEQVHVVLGNEIGGILVRSSRLDSLFMVK